MKASESNQNSTRLIKEARMSDHDDLYIEAEDELLFELGRLPTPEEVQARVESLIAAVADRDVEG